MYARLAAYGSPNDQYRCGNSPQRWSKWNRFNSHSIIQNVSPKCIRIDPVLSVVLVTNCNPKCGIEATAFPMNLPPFRKSHKLLASAYTLRPSPYLCRQLQFAFQSLAATLTSHIYQLLIFYLFYSLVYTGNNTLCNRYRWRWSPIYHFIEAARCNFLNEINIASVYGPYAPHIVFVVAILSVSGCRPYFGSRFVDQI